MCQCQIVLCDALKYRLCSWFFFCRFVLLLFASITSQSYWSVSLWHNRRQILQNDRSIVSLNYSRLSSYNSSLSSSILTKDPVEKVWSSPSTIWRSKVWAGVLWALKGAPGPNIWTFPSAIFAFGFMLLSFQAQFTSSLPNLRVFDYMPDYRPFVTAAGDCIFQSWQPLLGFQSFKFTIGTQKRPYTEKTCIFSKLLQ